MVKGYVRTLHHASYLICVSYYARQFISREKHTEFRFQFIVCLVLAGLVFASRESFSLSSLGQKNYTAVS